MGGWVAAGGKWWWVGGWVVAIGRWHGWPEAVARLATGGWPVAWRKKLGCTTHCCQRIVYSCPHGQSQILLRNDCSMGKLNGIVYGLEFCICLGHTKMLVTKSKNMCDLCETWLACDFATHAAWKVTYARTVPWFMPTIPCMVGFWCFIIFRVGIAQFFRVLCVVLLCNDGF